MNPISSNPNIWGSWSWNSSEDEVEGVAVNVDTGHPVYAPGIPPVSDPEKKIPDWPPIPFGD